MTYLELVNNVLSRMREDEVNTVQSIDDEAVRVIARLVNDAKTKVEQAWKWNTLRTEWTLTLVVDQDTYTLTPSDTYANLDYIWHNEKTYDLKKTSPRWIQRQGTHTAANPTYWAVNGSTTSRELKIQVWPKPIATDTLSVNGWMPQEALSADGDVLLVPAVPVIYEALAMALRERGEVGGQTAIEIFGVAKNYLNDAVAHDAAMNEEDSTWHTV